VRARHLLLPTLRDAPADAQALSHKLLVRAGFIRQLGAGLWTYLPLGWQTQLRITNVIREEMDAIGCQEMLMPVLLPAEYWKRSGRYVHAEVFKLKDRKGADMNLAMTHEEIVAFHAAAEIKSYRELPQSWYHIQTKERDEPRPQGGVLRVREFVMKDSYTLDRDAAGLDEAYDKQAGAYDRIFRRIGLDVLRVDSDVGMMGGTKADEYMALSEVGEDRVAVCPRCDYAANVELAVSVARQPDFPPEAPPEDVETPGVHTIEELASFLGIDPRTTMKAVLVVPEDERGGVVLAVVRGDHRVHELKLRTVLGTGFRAATPAEIQAAFDAEPGSIGARGIRQGALRDLVVDPVLTEGAYVAGANRTGWHTKNVRFGRDFTGRVADIRFAEAGEGCPSCGTPLEITPAIEVGNIFKIGTIWSEKFGATYLDEAGREHPIWMGSYGIGPARVMAAIVEQHGEAKTGIAWPVAVAPYDVWITPIGDPQLAFAGELEAELEARGLRVCVDDRELSPGVRFKDADLIGAPLRITVGRGFAGGEVELRRRATGETTTLAADVDAVAEAVTEARSGLFAAAL
jgi:prolyl-tRNA synthetase